MKKFRLRGGVEEVWFCFGFLRNIKAICCLSMKSVKFICFELKIKEEIERERERDKSLLEAVFKS